MTTETGPGEARPDEQYLAFHDDDQDERDFDFGAAFAALKARIKLLTVAPLLVGLTAVAVSFLVPPTYTARSSFLPPQQGQSSAATALASLGGLAGLVGGAAGVRSPGEQYVALMQSVTVSDRLIDQFQLMQVYDSKFRVDARKELGKNVRVTLGKKDGLIAVEVEDKSPQRAVDMANQYVDELRLLTSRFAITEAQQRRVFFEAQLQGSKEQLVKAQQALQASGFNPGALKVEPKAAAEGYAQLKADLTTSEVKLQVLRNSLTDSAPEVRQMISAVTALRSQLAQLEKKTDVSGAPDYIGRYREFKYQETLFELYARQFELARLDESRENALIQVVDQATPPERKTSPRRSIYGLAGFALTLLGLMGWVLVRRKP